MDRPIVFMFSGQGSHYYQMGRALFDQEPLFRDWLVEGHQRVSEWTSLSMLDQLYHDQHKKSDLFNQTLYTHPCIFMVEYALAQVVMSLGVKPHYLLGTSMGEFAAACLAGCIGFEKALESVMKQAEHLETYCPSSGGMLAVLGPLSIYEEHPLLIDHTTLASQICDTHFVVSGENETLDFAEQLLKEKDILFQRLAVSQSFHSPGISPAAAAYTSFLRDHVYEPPTLPLVSCAIKGSIDTIPPTYFWDIIQWPIRFRETIQNMEKKGSFTYLDLGPSGTLATFAKYHLAPNSQSVALPLLTPFGQDMKNLQHLLKTAASK